MTSNQFSLWKKDSDNTTPAICVMAQLIIFEGLQKKNLDGRMDGCIDDRDMEYPFKKCVIFL